MKGSALAYVYLVFFIAIALLYFYGPALKYKRPFFFLSASLAAFFCILGTFGFARYVQHLEITTKSTALWELLR